MNKTLKWLIIAIIILVIFLIIGKKQGWVGKSDVIKVTTEMAERRTIIETVTANGKIQPEIEVKISPDVSGEIIELRIKEGQEIKEGELLAKINPDLYISSVERLRASLNTSKANLANSQAMLIQAEASYKRNKKLFEEGVIPESDFETIKANFEVAEQNVVAAGFNIKSAEASLKEAQDQLAKTSIYAPVRGTVYGLKVEKGERVVGTSQMAGTEMMRLANLNEMEVSVEVNENDIVRVNHGDTSDIEVDAYLGRKFRGIVTEVANSANTEGVGADQVTNFTVKIRIIQNSYSDLIDKSTPNVSPFRPGMSATVDIQTETASGVLTVPIQAVTVRDDTSSTAGKSSVKMPKKKMADDEGKETVDTIADAEKIECVFIYNDGKAYLRVVETGVQDNTYIQVLKGIEEGEELITAPYSAVSKLLKNGRSVEKVPKDELFDDK